MPALFVWGGVVTVAGWFIYLATSKKKAVIEDEEEETKQFVEKTLNEEKKK